ncbi:MAG: ribosome maturation factor RimP [Candidatus Schekmanbacteria bacterium]|nr:ribosome maturation factor RimP [Candidatus Schekmanbacteria bacterium]
MLAKKLEEILLPVLNSENLELVEIKVGGAERRPVIKVFIDKMGGVAIKDCENVSRQFSTLLDVEGFEIDGEEIKDYVLEVSSPGLDRPLKSEKDFLKALGKNVTVTAKNADGKTKTFSGKIMSASENSFVIEKRGSKELEEIQYSSLVKAVFEVRF